MKKGIVYIATGRPYWLTAAIKSAVNLKDDLDVIIYNNIVEDGRINERIQLKNIQDLDLNFSQYFVSRELKTKLYELSPFDRTIYMDVDMLPLQSLEEIWEHKTGFATARSCVPTIGEVVHISEREKEFTLKFLPPVYPHRSSALILFDKSEVAKQIFHDWYQEWTRFRSHDQLALARAIAYKYAVLIMPQKYNQHYSTITVENPLVANYSGLHNKIPFLQS
jgi:hypothetical protein